MVAERVTFLISASSCQENKRVFLIQVNYSHGLNQIIKLMLIIHEEN